MNTFNNNSQVDTESSLYLSALQEYNDDSNLGIQEYNDDSNLGIQDYNDDSNLGIQEYNDDSNLDIQSQNNIKLNIKDDFDSRKQNPQHSQHIETLNLSKLQLNDSYDNDEPFDFFKRKTNATLGKKHKNTSIKQKPSRNNKYVDESTLNSYQSITDLRHDVKENVEICRNNIHKVKERKLKIENLEEKTELLLENSEFFKKKTRQLTLKMWFSNYLFHIVGILFFIGTIIFLIIKLS